MANARLHIICGNCGSNDMFEYKINIEVDYDDYDDDNDSVVMKHESISIICDNCSTIHRLDDYAKNT